MGKNVEVLMKKDSLMNIIEEKLKEIGLLENGNSNGKLRSFKRQNLPKGIAG